MQIHISLDASEPPAGTASLGEGKPVSFQGWLGLLGALNELVEQRTGNPQGAPPTMRSKEAE